jgi:hypothetical protein
MELQSQQQFQPITRTMSFVDQTNPPQPQQPPPEPIVHETGAPPKVEVVAGEKQPVQQTVNHVRKNYTKNGKFKFEVKGDREEFATCSQSLLIHRKPFDWYDNQSAMIVNESEQIVDL